MRITCVLGPYLPVPAVRGGAVEKIWLELCKEFARNGHDVTMISRRFQDFPINEMRDGIRHIRVASTDAPASKILYRLHDIIYALRVCRALPASEVTVTNSVSLPLLLPRTRAGIIYVSVARFPKGQLGLYKKAHRLQAVSSAVATAIRRQTPVLAERVRVIPNTISDTFLRLPNNSPSAKQKEVLYVGRIAREKGLDILIRAFLRMPPDLNEWTLTLLGPSRVESGGDGTSYLNELELLAESQKSRIRFEAPIFNEIALKARLKRAEIFAYPSVAEYGESFGMAPLEAMACGCAVIVSKLPCFADFIDAGENALTFDHKDKSGSSLADQLITLMKSPETRLRLSESAQCRALSFAPSRIAQMFISDFENLIAATTAEPSIHAKV